MIDDVVAAIQQSTEQALSEINTSMPGVIVSYSGGRAVVRPSLSKRLADGSVLTPPQIVSVPVMWPGGSAGGQSARLSMPLSAGDGVLLVFSQRCLEEWQAQNADAPSDPRMFDLTDAVAIPGLSAAPANASTDEMVMSFGAAKISISQAGAITMSTAGGSMTMGADGKVTFTKDVVIQGLSFAAHRHMAPNGATGVPYV